MDLAFSKGRAFLVCSTFSFNIVKLHVNHLAFFSSPTINMLALIPKKVALPSFLGKKYALHIDKQWFINGYVESAKFVGDSHISSFKYVEIQLAGALKYFGQSLISLSLSAAPIDEILGKLLQQMGMATSQYDIHSIKKQTPLVATSSFSYQLFRQYLSTHGLFFLSMYQDSDEKIVISDKVTDLLSTDISVIDDESIRLIREHSLKRGERYRITAANQLFYPGQIIEIENERLIVYSVMLNGHMQTNVGVDNLASEEKLLSEIILVKELMPEKVRKSQETCMHMATLIDKEDALSPYCGYHDIVCGEPNEAQPFEKGHLFYSNTGFSDFRLISGAKVLAVSIDGDMNRSVILGAIAPNDWYQGIRTKGSYQFCSYEQDSLCFDDEKSQLRLTSKSGGQTIQVDEKSIELSSDLVYDKMN